MISHAPPCSRRCSPRCSPMISHALPCSQVRRGGRHDRALAAHAPCGGPGAGRASAAPAARRAPHELQACSSASASSPRARPSSGGRARRCRRLRCAFTSPLRAWASRSARDGFMVCANVCAAPHRSRPHRALEGGRFCAEGRDISIIYFSNMSLTTTGIFISPNIMPKMSSPSRAECPSEINGHVSAKCGRRADRCCSYDIMQDPDARQPCCRHVQRRGEIWKP